MGLFVKTIALVVVKQIEIGLPESLRIEQGTAGTMIVFAPHYPLQRQLWKIIKEVVHLP